MATASDIATVNREDEVDRNLACWTMACCSSPSSSPGPALVAVAIAYARKRNTECAVKSHFRFQVFIFWVGFASPCWPPSPA